MLHAISSQPNQPHQCWQACRQDLGARHSSSATACTSLSAQVLHTHRASQCSVTNCCHTILVSRTYAHTHTSQSSHKLRAHTPIHPPTKQDRSQAGHPPLAAEHLFDTPSANRALHSARRHMIARCCMDCKHASRTLRAQLMARAHSAGCEATRPQTIQPSLGAHFLPNPFPESRLLTSMPATF